MAGTFRVCTLSIHAHPGLNQLWVVWSAPLCTVASVHLSVVITCTMISANGCCYWGRTTAPIG